MKYIDADKIRAEIERRMKHWHCFEFMDEMLNGPNGDDGFLFFLDSLQQEQQEVDLEKDIQDWMINECGPSDFNPYADHWCADDIINTARHFYELGRNARKEE